MAHSTTSGERLLRVYVTPASLPKTSLLKYTLSVGMGGKWAMLGFANSSLPNPVARTAPNRLPHPRPDAQHGGAAVGVRGHSDIETKHTLTHLNGSSFIAQGLE